MKKSMESAYTDMMNNLAKSSAAIPLHLQGAKGALAWWEQPDSLLAKSEIAPSESAADDLAKSHTPEQRKEAMKEIFADGDVSKEEAEELKDMKEDKEKEEDEDEEESDEAPEPAEEGMKKALAELDAIATSMLAKGDSYLEGQMEMFGDAPPPPKSPKKKKAREEKAPEQNGK